MKFEVFNIKIGLMFLLLGGLFAFYLGFTLEGVLVGGRYSIPFSRIFTRAGHTHGMLIGLYNILIGLILHHFHLTEGRKKMISISAAFSVLLPLGLIVRGADGGAMTYAFIPMLGSLVFLFSVFMTMISIGSCKK